MTTRGFLYSATLVVLIPSGGLAAMLSTVPMQGGMVMPMLAYHAADGRLTVQMDSTVPQLTPLMISNPGDSFDPTDPWFNDLDPTRQGLAFSRRYGFVMDAATDPLPDGVRIWIRKLSSTPGLGAYRYRSSTSKLWEPIFGTDGVTNALPWDGTMFHPGFTAPPGTAGYTATFEAFLVSTESGAPLAGGSTGPFTLNWTVVPDGRPALTMSQRIVVGWPTSATNYVLEATDALTGSCWELVTNTPVLVEGQLAVILAPADAGKFYRMRRAQ